LEKAYDLKDLGAKLKSRGMDVAEEGVKIIIEESCDWFSESAKLSQNPYDDMALVVLPILKSKALEAADKIDGKPDAPAA
jgi:hypothetical protein